MTTITGRVDQAAPNQLTQTHIIGAERGSSRSAAIANH